MASAMAYFQANRGKLSGQISANVVSSSRTSEGINYNYQYLFMLMIINIYLCLLLYSNVCFILFIQSYFTLQYVNFPLSRSVIR